MVYTDFVVAQDYQDVFSDIQTADIGIVKNWE